MTPLDLDDTAAVLAADRAGVLAGLATAAAQVREGATLTDAAALRPLQEDGRPRTLLVVAVEGDGADAARLVAAAAAPGAVPVLRLVAPAPAPGSVGPLDLVLVLAPSGDEPALLALLPELARRGARLAAVTPAPSPVADLVARARGVLLELPRARAAQPPGTVLWALVTPALLACAGVGAGSTDAAALEAAAVALEVVAARCRPDAEAVTNPAKTLAQELGGPLVLLAAPGAEPGTALAVARAARHLAVEAGVACLADAGDLERLRGVLTVTGEPAEPALADPLEALFRDRAEDDELPAAPPVVLLEPEPSTAGDALRGWAADRGAVLLPLAVEPTGLLARAATAVGLLDAAVAYRVLAARAAHPTAA